MSDAKDGYEPAPAPPPQAYPVAQPVPVAQPPPQAYPVAQPVPVAQPPPQAYPVAPQAYPVAPQAYPVAQPPPQILQPAGTWAPPSPIPGIPVKPPRMAAQPGMMVVSYEICEPNVGCCKCDTLSTGGVIAIVILVLLFPIGACIPCCMASCHTQTQRPVYGFPPGAGHC